MPWWLVCEGLSAWSDAGALLNALVAAATNSSTEDEDMGLAFFAWSRNNSAACISDTTFHRKFSSRTMRYTWSLRAMPPQVHNRILAAAFFVVFQDFFTKKIVYLQTGGYMYLFIN